MNKSAVHGAIRSGQSTLFLFVECYSSLLEVVIKLKLFKCSLHITSLRPYPHQISITLFVFSDSFAFGSTLPPVHRCCFGVMMYTPFPYLSYVIMKFYMTYTFMFQSLIIYNYYTSTFKCNYLQNRKL